MEKLSRHDFESFTHSDQIALQGLNTPNFKPLLCHGYGMVSNVCSNIEVDCVLRPTDPERFQQDLVDCVLPMEASHVRHREVFICNFKTVNIYITYLSRSRQLGFHQLPCHWGIE